MISLAWVDDLDHGISKHTAIDTSSGVAGSKTQAGFWLDDANQ